VAWAGQVVGGVAGTERRGSEIVGVRVAARGQERW
jgi:hypothetical protein